VRRSTAIAAATAAALSASVLTTSPARSAPHATASPVERTPIASTKAPTQGKQPKLRDVMFVGNNWSGNASIVDAHSLKMLKRGINLIPDKSQELADIQKDPERLAFFLAIQQGPGEGHNQYVDDMFTTKDGKYLAVSRPSFADVVWVDIAKATAGRPDSIVREQQMDGHRTDHMGLSPDGRRLVVSDSTARQVIEYSMVNETVNGKRIRMGDRLRTFESGETPHENTYNRQGSRVYHASIGRVYTPGDEAHSGPVKIPPAQDAIKGDRWFQIVRNRDFSIAKRWDMGKELAEAGHEGMSSAVRPMAVSPDERFIYYQVSYFHGLVEFDTRARDINGRVDYTAGGVPEPRRGAVTRLLPLPNRVPDMPLTLYVNDSAHHGMSLNPAGRKLCVAGTMDDYAAIVDRRSFRYKILDKKTTGHYYGKPYWTTEGPGNRCWISLSEADAVAVVDYATGKELAYLKVGDHPQRVRHGYVPERLVRSWTGTGVDDRPGKTHPEAALLEAESEHSGVPQDSAKELYFENSSAETQAPGKRSRTQRTAATPATTDVATSSQLTGHPATPWAAAVLLLLALASLRRRPRRG
jgi:MYXO-CTERM domain-containing protein